jgi:hypothetical protein
VEKETQKLAVHAGGCGHYGGEKRNVRIVSVCLLLQDLVQSCLHGGGGEGYGRTCATRYDEPRPVWTRLPILSAYCCL